VFNCSDSRTAHTAREKGLSRWISAISEAGGTCENDAWEPKAKNLDKQCSNE
jgi:hypothetical protein